MTEGEKIENLKKELKRVFLELARKQAEFLKERNPESYKIGVITGDYYHNGVGLAKCSEDESLFDEDSALEDAKNTLVQDVRGNSRDFETAYNLFIEDSALADALADVLETF